MTTQCATAHVNGQRCPNENRDWHARTPDPAADGIDALAVMPRIERLDLARIELPDDDPAADLGRSGPVHGFLIEHPDETILVGAGVQVLSPTVNVQVRGYFLTL